jgi:alpha-1,6-mannosyltransferase
VACADAIERLLQRDVTERRRVARKQAERFDWPTAVNGFLSAHQIRPAPHDGSARTSADRLASLRLSGRLR